MTRALDALRRACATGRDAQTVTVRRGHLRWLLAEYDRAVGVTVPAHIRAERGCMGCAHDGGGSDCDACDYPEWPHWEPRSAAADATPAPTLAVPCAQTPRPVVAALTAWRDSSPLLSMRRVGPAASTIAGVDWIAAAVGGELLARYVETGLGTHTSHFATCPHAAQHRGHGQGSLPGMGA